MQHWVFTIGQRDLAPPTFWLEDWSHHATAMWFPDSKKPRSIQRGDRALIYGSQGRGLLAAVEVTSDGPLENGHERYPWKTTHHVLLAKLADRHVADPAEAGIETRRVARGPHTKIDVETYERGVAVLAAAAERSASA